jgi:hypothetical protein
MRVPNEEIQQVAHRVVRYAHHDETTPLGHVLLRTEDGRRTWAATDAYRGGQLVGGAADPTPDVLVPQRLLDLPAAAEHVHLEIVDDPDTEGLRSLTLSIDSLRVSAAAMELPFPDINEVRNRTLAAPHHRVEVDVEVLAHAVAWLAQRAPETDRDRTARPLELTLRPGSIRLSVDRPRIGEVLAEVPADCGARGSVLVNPWYLHQMLAGGQGETAELLVPAGRGFPLWISQGPWSGYVMPIDPLRNVRGHVEEMLREGYGLDELIADEDGDYPFQIGDETMFVRLVEGADPTLKVFGILLDGVAASPDLMTELNDINAHIQFARVFWVEEQVLLESEIVASELDHDELRTACNTVSRLLTELGPMLRARFGGDRAGA